MRVYDPCLVSGHSHCHSVTGLLGQEAYSATARGVDLAGVLLAPACLLLYNSPLGSLRGSPQCHCIRCRLCRCAASSQSPPPSLTGPSGLAAHDVTALRVNCAGLLPPACFLLHHSPGSWLRPPSVRARVVYCAVALPQPKFLLIPSPDHWAGQSSESQSLFVPTVSVCACLMHVSSSITLLAAG